MLLDPSTSDTASGLQRFEFQHRKVAKVATDKAWSGLREESEIRTPGEMVKYWEVVLAEWYSTCYTRLVGWF